MQGKCILKAALHKMVGGGPGVFAMLFPLKLARRFFQRNTHPHWFARTVQLTDGSITQLQLLNAPIKMEDVKEVDPEDDPLIKRLAVQAEILQLNTDSLSHASWNPRQRREMGKGSGEGVEKMRKWMGAGLDEFLTDVPEMAISETKKTAEAKKTVEKKESTSKAKKK